LHPPSVDTETSARTHFATDHVEPPQGDGCLASWLKVMELKYNDDGTIQTVDAYRE
jgi:hypothetical protein